MRNVERELEKNALSAPSRETLLEGAIAGMTEAVGDSPYTAYLPPSEQTDYKRELQGQFAGVGMRSFVKDANSGEFYFVVLRDSPADKAGLKLGDRIVAVDGQPTSQLSLFELTDKLRGPEKTSVTLTIRPRSTISSYVAGLSTSPNDASVANVVTQTDNTTADITEDSNLSEVVVTRDVIQQDVVSGDRLDANGKWIFTLKDAPSIGYVAIEQFVDSTAQQTHDALAQLQHEGVQKIILDFRGNPGGFLPNAIAICEELLADGSPIVETRNRKGVTNRYVAHSKKGKRFQVAILIDHDSASASEIVSAALQDAGAAKLIGVRSYGKGTIQGIYDLPCNAGTLRMTTASFWRPSGKPIHRQKDAKPEDEWGVSPDPGFEVPISQIDYFYYHWVRAVRVSTTEASALDARAYAFITAQTNSLLKRLFEAPTSDKMEAAAELGFDLDSLQTFIHNSGATSNQPDSAESTNNSGEVDDANATSDEEPVVDAEASTNANAVPLLENGIFTPRGRAPYFDPQLDKAIDYLLELPADDSIASPSAFEHNERNRL